MRVWITITSSLLPCLLNIRLLLFDRHSPVPLKSSISPFIPSSVLTCFKCPTTLRKTTTPLVLHTLLLTARQKTYPPPAPPPPPCLPPRLWHSHCADLTDARFEYETCVVSATCRQTKPKTP